MTLRAPRAATVAVTPRGAIWLFGLILAGMILSYGAIGKDVLHNPIHTGIEADPYSIWYNRLRYLLIGASFALALLGRSLYRVTSTVAPLLPYGLFALASTVWTADVEITLRSAFLMLGMMFCAAIVIDKIGLRRAMLVLLHCLALIVLISTALAVALPDIGRHSPSDAVELTHVGQWRGVFSHKNALGSYSSIAALLLLIQPGTDVGAGRAWRPYFWFCAACALACVAFSGSANAVAGLIVGLGVFAVLRHRSLAHPMVLTGLVVMGVVTAVAASAGAEQIAILLGRDPTFTGRTEIWNSALALFWGRPLIGYGYIAGDTHVLGPMISQTLFSSAVDAHNGYLELLLGVGAVGVVLFFGGVFVVLRRGYRVILGPPSPLRRIAVAVTALTAAILAMAMGEVAPFRPVANGGQILILALVMLAAMGPKAVAKTR